MLNVQRASVSFAPGTKTVDGRNQTQRIEKQIKSLMKSGKLFHDAKNMDKAIESYSEAIEIINNLLNPQVFDKLKAIVLVLRGNVYREQNHRDLAAQDSKAACKLDPISAMYLRIY
jgi:tetratricopeptide (TPR) repeat protein